MPSPSQTSPTGAPKVVLISLDGATNTIVKEYLKNGVLDPTKGIGLLASKGVFTSGNQTITPSLTAPSHMAIATGSTAVNNDINSNFTPATQATIDRLKTAQQTSFSPIQIINKSLDKFTVNGVNFDFQFAAIDTTNDGKVNYDSIVVYDAVAGIKADSSNIATLKVGNPSQ